MNIHTKPVRSPKIEDATRTPATQLEIAAHWLEEAATAIQGDAALRLNLGRVAHECKAVAFRERKIWTRIGLGGGACSSPIVAEQQGGDDARIVAIRKVRDGYADQARFADIDCAVHFREFVRRIDAALLA